MPINCYSSSVAVTAAALALLLLPVQYLQDISAPEKPLISEPSVQLDISPLNREHVNDLWVQFSTLDLFISLSLLLVGFLIYLGEWIQRKLLERRIMKLHEILMGSLEQLYRWDARQEQLETTLKVVQNATAEYNLLLHLLLRRRQRRPLSQLQQTPPPPAKGLREKELLSHNY